MELKIIVDIASVLDRARLVVINAESILAQISCRCSTPKCFLQKLRPTSMHAIASWVGTHPQGPL